MILFHDVVQVSALPRPTPLRQLSFCLQFPDRRWIRRVLVYVDHPRRWIARRLKRFAEEAFRRRSIALSRKQEVNRLTGGVHRTIQVLLLAVHL